MTIRLLLLLLVFAGTSLAQVAISGSIVQTFDNNVFLESGDPLVIPEGVDFVPNDRIDGEEDSDFITYTGLTFSTARDIPAVASISASIEGGVFFFADYSELNRFALNSNVGVQADDELIPGFSLGLTDVIRTSARDAGSTESSASNTLTTHTISLNAGTQEYRLSERSGTSVTYTFGRTDALGDLGFNSDSQDDLEAALAGESDEGASYFSHTLSNRYSYDATQLTRLGLNITGSYLDFTDAGGNDLINQEEDDQDRLGLDLRLGADSQVSQMVAVSGGAGFSLAKFSEDRDPESVVVINPDGTTSVVLEDRDDQTTNFVFDAGLQYVPTSSTNFGVSVSQATGTDLDGDRLLTRSVNLNASSQLTERLVLTGLASFFQFTSDDSLSNSSDRFEIGATARYQISPFVAVSCGYNYASQDADEANDLVIISRINDYDVHRAFVTVDVGMVGLLDS